jgi:NAD(P)-dependent dehydrogenase (short-subunit alcohol dehydrogenase family)
MPSPTPPTTQTTTPTTWFITGTSSGLGRCLTERLLARGDRVAATVRDPAALDDLAARYGDRLWVASLDVTDAGAVRAVVDRAFADLGRVDVVVSNAGYGLFGAAEELDDAAVQRQVDTNLVGSIALIRASLPHLGRRGAAASSRFRPRAGSGPTPASAPTTRPSGASRASWRPSRRRSRRSASPACSPSSGRRAPSSA